MIVIAIKRLRVVASVEIASQGVFRFFAFVNRLFRVFLTF